MKRDLSRLTAEYEKKYYNAPTNSKRGQFWLSDYMQIMEMSKDCQGGGVDLYDLVSNALKAGFMIGYNTRRADERDNRRKQKGSL